MGRGINKALGNIQKIGLELVWDSEQLILSDVIIKNDRSGWLHGFRPKSAAKTCVQECDLRGHSHGRHRKAGRVRVGPAFVCTHILYGDETVRSQCSVSWRGQSLHA